MTSLRPVAIAAVRAGRRGVPFAVSMTFHSLLALAVVLVPLLVRGALPSISSDTAFAAPIVEIRTLPPPPAAQGSPTHTARPHPAPTPTTNGLVTPGDVPTALPPPDDLLGDAEGDPDGVVGGVFDLRRDSRQAGMVHIAPEPAPTPPPRVVRISQVAAPLPLVRVAPVYPKLASQIGLAGVVMIEAEVDTTGHVSAARVVSGNPLLQEAALEAVRQWRYRPLLLNGEPTGFILSVTVEFQLRRS